MVQLATSTADRVGVDAAAGGRRARRAAATTSAGPAGHRTATVSKNCVVRDLDAALAQRRRRAPRRSGARASRSRAGRPGRGRRRTSTRDHGEQHLRGADVGGRLVAADVLLAGLQREPVRRTALGVDRHADQPAGQVPLEAGAHRHEAGVRTAVPQRHAEPLRRADHDVGAELAGRLEQGQREQVGGDDGQRAALVRGLDHRSRVADLAGRARVLHEHAAQVAVGQAVGEVGLDHLDAHRLGPGVHDGERLRQASASTTNGPEPPCGSPRRTSVIASAAAVASSSRTRWRSAGR